MEDIVPADIVNGDGVDAVHVALTDREPVFSDKHEDRQFLATADIYNCVGIGFWDNITETAGLTHSGEADLNGGPHPHLERIYGHLDGEHSIDLRIIYGPGTSDRILKSVMAGLAERPDRIDLNSYDEWLIDSTENEWNMEAGLAIDISNGDFWLYYPSDGDRDPSPLSNDSIDFYID
jgi:hypothetical protein